ncbi:MAG: secretin N-terminal domain-containing protein, partial [Bacillota bacterium]
MKNKTLKIFVFILVFVLLSQVGLEASEEYKINMSFKDADLKDVLRTIAELSGINLITDTQINDTITINLSDISFVKALDVLTQSNKLDYRIDDNIVVVSTKERLNEIYKKVELEIISINSGNLDEIKNIVNGVYPDVNLQLDKANQQIIITGVRERINLAEKLISKIDLPVDKNDSLEIIELTENRGQNSLIGLETIFKNMEFIELNDKLIVKGEKNSIKEVSLLIEELELTPEEKNVDNTDIIDEVEETTEITFMPLKYSDIEKTAHLLENVFPEINIQQDERNQQLVIIASADQTKEIKGFLEEIDVPLPPEEKNTTTKMLELNNTLAAGEVEKINVLYPDLLLVKIQETLVIRGQEKNVDQAVNFIEEIKKKELQKKEEEKNRAEQQKLEDKAKLEDKPKVTEEKITKIFEVDHVNPENLKQMINDVYPDL